MCQTGPEKNLCNFPNASSCAPLSGIILQIPLSELGLREKPFWEAPATLGFERSLKAPTQDNVKLKQRLASMLSDGIANHPIAFIFRNYHVNVVFLIQRFVGKIHLCDQPHASPQN